MKDYYRLAYDRLLRVYKTLKNKPHRIFLVSDFTNMPHTGIALKTLVKLGFIELVSCRVIVNKNKTYRYATGYKWKSE